MFLYLTLYIQDNLGYGPLAAGIRFLPMTLLIFFTSFFAGRLTVRVQSRLLLGVGMLVVSGGLLLMATTHPNSTWTVLLPGFLVCGFGVGIVNPVLASGAVSVVQPQRSGMASGANNTFRQVGIATGIAVLGAVFQSQIVAHTTAALAKSPYGTRGPAPGRCATPGRHVRRGCTPGGGLVPGRRPQRAAGRLPLRLLGHVEPPDGDRRESSPSSARSRAFALVRQRDFVDPDRAAAPGVQPGAPRGRQAAATPDDAGVPAAHA